MRGKGLTHPGTRSTHNHNTTSIMKKPTKGKMRTEHEKEKENTAECLQIIHIKIKK